MDGGDHGGRDPGRPRRREQARDHVADDERVVNMAATTPSMMGMPVRGDVVSRHHVSAPALASGACAAAASRRASAWRALANLHARPSFVRREHAVNY